MCCQKISEAVALIESQHQVDDVFISNQIVDPAKLERLVRLSLLHDRKVKLSATVDDIEGMTLV
jgi:D-serine deaminase-like pyridoxal phosphate-dependent protein